MLLICFLFLFLHHKFRQLFVYLSLAFLNLLDSRNQSFKKWVKYGETENKAIKACSTRIFLLLLYFQKTHSRNI